jgi:hypothetical protein
VFSTVYDEKIIGPSAFAIVQWIGFIFVWFVFFVVNDILCMVDKKKRTTKDTKYTKGSNGGGKSL